MEKKLEGLEDALAYTTKKNLNIRQLFLLCYSFKMKSILAQVIYIMKLYLKKKIRKGWREEKKRRNLIIQKAISTVLKT